MRRSPVILLLAALVAFSPALRAEQPTPPPQLKGAHAAVIVRSFLSNHYAQEPLDKVHSQRMLAQYLAGFDPEHYYFTSADLRGFQKFGPHLGDMLLKGDISPAFTIFDIYKQRVDERTAQALKILGESFDFKGNDTLLTDRKKAPYPANSEAAIPILRNRIKFELYEMILSGKTEKEARDILSKRYRNQKLRLAQINNNDLVSAYINAVTAAYDPHSTYLPPDELENFQINMRLSLEGIGATLRWEDGFTIVTAIVPGGAASREGTLQPEDKIVAVGQGSSGPMEDVRNLRLSDVVKLIRGEKGSSVRIEFLRRGEGKVETRRAVTIIRDTIVLKEGEAHGSVQEIPREGGKPYRVGVIVLPSFYADFNGMRENPKNYKSSARDVENLLKGFQKQNVDGVVLDLRNNGGGSLDEVVNMAGLFLPPGPVVLWKDNTGRVNAFKNPYDQPLYKGPLVVLTNRNSASASEILAGVIQDYGRGLIVGEVTTFGKGTVQNIFYLDGNLGALKTTVAKFYRPSSSSTQNKGVPSDIVFPSVYNHMDIGESSMDNAMSWDAIQPSRFTPAGDLSAYIPVLVNRSRGRVKDNPAFKDVREAVAAYLKNRKGRDRITMAELREEHHRLKGKALPTDGEEPESSGKPKDKKDDIYLKETLAVMGDLLSLSEGKPAGRQTKAGQKSSQR
ncbi:MAG: carboxy terminal-processing peptidase [Deltaproteobacteria bacterium]|nr:carboxy terminal-processing peptidase [Deltaproteobacteria bacterium]